MSTARKTLINSPDLSFGEICANFRWQVPTGLTSAMPSVPAMPKMPWQSTTKKVSA